MALLAYNAGPNRVVFSAASYHYADTVIAEGQAEERFDGTHTNLL